MGTIPVEDSTVAVTNEELGRRLDIIGQQLNWLCENLTSLFGFVNAMSNNGGGVRGLMKALKEQQPATESDESNV